MCVECGPALEVNSDLGGCVSEELCLISHESGVETEQRSLQASGLRTPQQHNTDATRDARI